MAAIGLALHPLDTLFFRDGRPFDAATRAEGGLPTPQTLAGAIRTALLRQAGFDFEKFAHVRRKSPSPKIRDDLHQLDAPPWALEMKFRGPWLALKKNQCIEPLLPVPANLAREEKSKQWFRADPLKDAPPGWDDHLKPLWRKDGLDAKHPGGYLTPKGIEKFLHGEKPDDDDWLEASDLFDFDLRTGIEVDPYSLTAAESKVYTIKLLALRRKIEKKCENQTKCEHQDKEVCLYAEAITEERNWPLSGPISFGGEGRQVRVEKVDPVTWKEHRTGKNTVLLLTTPAFLPNGLPKSSDLIAAAWGTPLAVSGWDVARGGPKPTRFAVPAGSVYFLEGNSPPPEPLGDNGEEGWGHFLRGSWNYA